MPTCRDCGDKFALYKGKPGFINQCSRCGIQTEEDLDEERMGGNMIYLHKTGGYIEVKTLREAQQFAAKTQRLGAGVTKSIAESKAFHEKSLD